MLDEELDHIIREAAAKHNPNYNDKAWEMMEMQLDKHLPQKKDRRRFLFLLWFFLLLGAGAFLSINYFTGNKTSGTKPVPVNAGNKGNEALTSTVKKTATPGNSTVADPTGKNSTVPFTSPAGENRTSSLLQASDVNKVRTNNKDRIKSTLGNNSEVRMSVIAAAPIKKSMNGEAIVTDLPIQGSTWNKLNAPITSASSKNNEPERANSNPLVSNSEKSTSISPSEQLKAGGKETERDLPVTQNKSSLASEKKKPNRSFADNFGLTFSAGPDFNFVSLNRAGKATLTYGAGVSYKVSKRVTVKTGFYSSKKIYTATPDQYHLSGGVAYPNLTGIDANCNVSEIPVNVSYNFGQRKNHSWFGSTGLSSFLMKTEKYNYQYKTATGQTYQFEKQISNQNKHYFSILTLSGGYQYQLSKRVSLQAEPNLKLPLTGIGLGKIKLNSSGLLLTVTVKPFAKRK